MTDFDKCIAVINSMFGKYNLTEAEEKALEYLVANAKQVSSDCIYYVGDYYFHRIQDAKMAAKNSNAPYILEKKRDERGNVTTKKYKLVKGEIIGVQKI